MSLTLLLLACGAPPLSSLGTGTGTAKAPSGEYCDGEDNDGDGTVDEDCGTCDMLRTRVRSWWQDAECVVEGGGTGRSLYPISVGTTNNYYTWDTLGSFLAAPVVTDKGRLGQQIAVAKLNSKAFGIGAIPYHDWDADGDLETVDELLALADTIFSGFDATAQVDMFNVVVALNSEGNALPSWIDQHCARDAEYCDGLDNDGNGTVDDNCGCVEVCDGYDNDFDGATDESGADNDRDGFDCDDCDDTRARTYPGAYDVPENAIDDDCDGTDPQYTYDYDEDVQPIYDAYCVGCHGPGGQSPDLSPGVSYANTVGVASTQLSSYVLVQPASTSQSYLYRKVQGNHTAVGGSGGRMPLGGPYLSFAQSGILGTWITEGAPPSCPDADGDGWECTDCDDNDPTIYPGAPETKGDEIDQNCDDADDLYTYGLEEDIQPLFTTYCTSCHGATVQQLGLRLDEGYTLSETVNVPSTQLPSMDLLEPGDHTTSYLYHKLAGSHRTVGGAGNRMPQGGPFFLAEVLEMIAFWIDEGAPANACNDADGDVWSCNDCDDGDAAVNPDAVEACDGVDNNCDGSVDEGLLGTYYTDADLDGFGDAASPVSACGPSEGVVADATDCDDLDPGAYPGAPETCDGADQDCDGAVDDDAADATAWYADADADGSGNPADVAWACEAPSGYVADNADCDDTNGAVNVGAAEICNGLDDDCDGLTDDADSVAGASAWYADNDADGFGDAAASVNACTAPPGYVADTTDCDDTSALTYPGAPETAGDGIDQDCDGSDLTLVLGVEDLLDGDLVVTEVMQNPEAVTDSFGEWFEIYNASGFEVELSGLVATDNGSNTFTVAGSLVVAPGEYAVLGDNASTAVNGNVTLDYEYGSYTLSNASDAIRLGYGSVVVDVVAWDDGATFPDPAGASMALDPDNLDAIDNDAGANWCTSTTTFGAGDEGTPGTMNDDCAEPVDLDGDGWTSTEDCDDTDPSVYPGAPEIEDDGIDQDCDGADATSTAGVADLAAGDLVVSEILFDPTAAADPTGEWFEVYNASGFDVDLNGLVVYDVTSTGSVQSTFTVSGTLLVAAGDYVVLGDTANSATNGGATVDYDYPNWALGNSGDEVYLSYGATIFDSVTWTTTTFPDPVGASIAVDPARMDATNNNNGANWCTSTTTFGLGDEGTPGAENDWCIDPDDDADGYPRSTDCDDADPTAYPGATETTDGVDNDCDGTVDEVDAVPVRIVLGGNFQGAGSCSDSTFTGCDLYQVDLTAGTWDVSSVTRLTSVAAQGEMFPSIDRTGSYVAYQSAVGSTNNVVVMNLATLSTATFASGRYPDFAHHADQLMWNDASRQVWVADYGTSTGLPVSTSSSVISTDGRDPQFFPDGNTLIWHAQPSGEDSRTVVYDVATGVTTNWSDIDDCAHAAVDFESDRAVCQVGTQINYRDWDGTAWGTYSTLLLPDVPTAYPSRYHGCDFLTFSYPEFCGSSDWLAVAVNCFVGPTNTSSSIMVFDVNTGDYVDLHGSIETALGVTGKQSRTISCTEG